MTQSMLAIGEPDRRGAAQAAATLVTPSNAMQRLVGGSEGRAGAHLGEMLNRSPQVLLSAQRAEALSQRSAAAIQRYHAAPPHTASPVTGGAAVVQRLPDWRSVARLAGGALGGYAGAQVGATAGGYLGAQAGAYAGAWLGPAGALGGAVLGGLGGLLLGGYGATRLTPRAPTNTRVRATENLIYDRAVALAERDGKGADPDAFVDYLEPALREDMRQFLKEKPNARQGEVTERIRNYYEEKGTLAQPGQYARDSRHNELLTKVLFEDPYIKRVLAGGLDDRSDERRLGLPRGAPGQVQRAGRMFDRLVEQDGEQRIPPITSVVRRPTPESAIGHQGNLHLGLATPAGVVLHELGHHLEHNLLPSNIATLHNFLRARSSSDRLRTVGYEPLIGLPQVERGYDAELPRIDAGNQRSLAALVGRDTVPYWLGSREAEKRIDQFVIGHGNRRELSYATQVYGSSGFFSQGGVDTEFLSTTIHFFAHPDTAAELVERDPLRVALFLSLANPTAYARVKAAFEEESGGAKLDTLIHRVDAS